MEIVTMKKRFVIVKVVSIMLLIVAGEAQEFFPFDYSSSEETSLLTESEFLQDFQDTKFSLETQNFPSKTQSYSGKTSLSSESEFPDVSEDSQEIFETQQFPSETESNSEIYSPPPSPEPLPSPSPSPSETPLPAKAPLSPKRPWTPEKMCKTRCAANCMRKKVPILHNLCNKVCRKRCILHYSQLIYHCTSHCAKSMPKKFKSDKKKEASYVKYCYHKCIKKF
ncbi:hypothetical protein DITRI_Ditri15bG0110000 [Diplodiscus trichospermus]